MIKKMLLFALLLLVPLQVFGVDKYVRQGASGSGSGADWINAYSSLPAALVRGDTYYVADGSYGGYSFDDTVSGSTAITIKKATIANHGKWTVFE